MVALSGLPQSLFGGPPRQSTTIHAVHAVKLAGKLRALDYSAESNDDDDDDDDVVDVDDDDDALAILDGFEGENTDYGMWASPARAQKFKRSSGLLLTQALVVKNPVMSSNMKRCKHGHTGKVRFDHDFPSLTCTGWEERAYELLRNKRLKEHQDAAQHGMKKIGGEQQNTPNWYKERSASTTRDESNFSSIEGLELHKKCGPLVQYLLSLGIEKEKLKKIAKRRKLCFYVSVSKARERIGYLKGLGLVAEDISRIIERHPRVLEYSVEGMMKPHIQYLQSIGIPDTRLGKAVVAAPALLELSLERSLKPRVRFLVEEVGINASDVWKVVILSPQILTQHVDDSLRPRMGYLLKTLGISREILTKTIMKHPQLFHYSSEFGIKPKIEFLRAIGMSDFDIVKVVSRLSQILSLSVEKSLKPKCDYLFKELKCGVQDITSFPAYFSLSMERRIRPRHEFLRALKKLPEGPFPLHLFALTDKVFCERWAMSTVDEYDAFRQRMLLVGFAKQFEKRNRLKYDRER